MTFNYYKNKFWKIINKKKNCIESYAQAIFIKYKDKITFFKAVVNDPRATGAISPSSKQLASEMVSHVFKEKEGIVVELGAGTGVITKALLQSGIKSEDIIIIEYSHELVAILQDRFPKIKIIEGTAEHLSVLLINEKRKLNTIVSSIPLRSLPLATSRAILDEIQHNLPSGGRYIQFTYSFKRNRSYSISNFKCYLSKRVWMNLPPARVDVWVKH